MANVQNDRLPYGRKVPTGVVTVIDLAKELGLHKTAVTRDLRERLGIEIIMQRPPGKPKGQLESTITRADADRYRAWREGHPAAAEEETTLEAKGRIVARLEELKLKIVRAFDETISTLKNE